MRSTEDVDREEKRLQLVFCSSARESLIDCVGVMWNRESREGLWKDYLVLSTFFFRVELALGVGVLPWKTNQR